jgi:hypothetical protein
MLTIDMAAWIFQSGKVIHDLPDIFLIDLHDGATAFMSKGEV